MRKLISRKQDDNIRWIFHSLFFYDLLESFATATENKCFLRGRIQTSLAAKVYQQITGDAGLSGPVDDIVVWAKVRYVFHLSGKELENAVTRSFQFKLINPWGFLSNGRKFLQKDAMT